MTYVVLRRESTFTGRFHFCLTICLTCLVGSQVAWSETTYENELVETTQTGSLAQPKAALSNEAQRIVDQIEKLTKDLSELRDRVQHLGASVPAVRSKQKANPASLRRVSISSWESGTSIIISSKSSDTNFPAEQITQISGGVNIRIEQPRMDANPSHEIIDLSADRAVMYSDDFGTDTMQAPESKLQVYLEGHVAIHRKDDVRQHTSKITAARAYYDASANRATYFDAEFETSSQVDGQVRLRADEVREKMSQDTGFNPSFIDANKKGMTGYQVQSSDLVVESRVRAASSDGLTTGTAILFFGATWCGPCQQMDPVVHRMQRQGLPIRSVDVDKEKELTKKYHVESIPCFVLLKDQHELNRITGVATEKQLRDFFKSSGQSEQRKDVQCEIIRAQETTESNTREGT